MTDQDCARLHELGPELALGVLPGDQRALALAHVNRCPSCRDYLRELTAVEDGLLALVPAAEPPVGFEDRVLAGLGITDRPAPRVRRVRSGRRAPRRWLPLAVAAAVVALVCGTLGWMIGDSAEHGTAQAIPAPAVESDLVRADLMTADHHKIGQVFAYLDKDSWMYVSVQAGRYTGSVSCEMTRSGGGPVSAGWFDLTDGRGYWGTPVRVPPDQLTGISLKTAGGTVLAAATFPR